VTSARRHRRAIYWDDWDSSCQLEREVEDADYLRHLLCAITPRQMSVVVALYGLDGQPPMEQTELAGEYGLSQSRIFQLKEKAIKRMRQRHLTLVRPIA